MPSNERFTMRSTVRTVPVTSRARATVVAFVLSRHKELVIAKLFGVPDDFVCPPGDAIIDDAGFTNQLHDASGSTVIQQ